MMSIGRLYIVATPIGNLEDITLRALRILKEVDLIAAEDTRETRKLLSHFDIHTELTSFFKGNEKSKASHIIDKIESGSSVALVSEAGTPCISDPGYPLLAAAIEAGIEVVPIPGASALTAAMSASGLPTDRFTFAGFLPDKKGRRQKILEELKTLDHTIVFYVSKWKWEGVLTDCLEILGDRDACLCRELTKVHEEFLRGKISEILKELIDRPPKGELTLVIGKSD